MTQNGRLDSANPLLLGIGGLLCCAALFGILQFFSPVFDHWRMFGIGWAAIVAIGGIALASWALDPSEAPRARALALAAGVMVGGLALVVLHIKLSYPATFANESRFTLPHGPTDYDLPHRVLSFQASDGVQIAGTYLGDGHRPGVILYPSWVSGQHGLSDVTMAEWLASRFDVLVLDPRGVGSSGGWQGPDGAGKYDIQAGAAFLRQQGDPSVGALAEGDSASAAILAVSQLHVLDALAIAGAPAYWGEHLAGEPRYLSPLSPLGRLYWRLAAGVRLEGDPGRSLADLVAPLTPVPVLFLGAAGDPQSVATRLYAAAADPRGLRLLSGSGRPGSWSSFADYFHTVRDWFSLTLSASPAVAATAAASPSAMAQATGSMIPALASASQLPATSSLGKASSSR